MAKKLTSKFPISLRIDGSILLEISEEGCLASDASAAVAVARLGDHINVEDVSVDEAVAEAKASVKKKGKKDKDAEVEPVVEDVE